MKVLFHIKITQECMNMTGKRQAKKDGVDDSDEETTSPVQIKPKRPHKRKYTAIYLSH